MTSPCAKSRVATPPTPAAHAAEGGAVGEVDAVGAKPRDERGDLCAEPSPAPGAPRVPNERARNPSEERRRCRLPNHEGDGILDHDEDARTTRASRPRHPIGDRDIQDIEGAVKSRERDAPDAATRMSKCPRHVDRPSPDVADCAWRLFAQLCDDDRAR